MKSAILNMNSGIEHKGVILGAKATNTNAEICIQTLFSLGTTYQYVFRAMSEKPQLLCILAV